MEAVKKLESRVDELNAKMTITVKNWVEGSHVWVRPQKGWLVVNTDAAAHNGRNALAMVARDENGVIIHLATTYLTGLSAKLAKLKALDWAMTVGEDNKVI